MTEISNAVLEVWAQVDPSVWKIVLPMAGTLLGAFVGVWYAMKANKERRTMELTMWYLKEVYPKEGRARGVLDLCKCRTLKLDEIDGVRYVGDWFDVYAALATTRSLSRRLRKRTGLDKIVGSFWDQYRGSAVQRKIVDEDPRETWPNIDRLARRRHPLSEIRSGMKMIGAWGSRKQKSKESAMKAKVAVYSVPKDQIETLHTWLKDLEGETATDGVQVVIVPALAGPVKRPANGKDDAVADNPCPHCGKNLSIEITIGS